MTIANKTILITGANRGQWPAGFRPLPVLVGGWALECARPPCAYASGRRDWQLDGLRAAHRASALSCLRAAAGPLRSRTRPVWIWVIAAPGDKRSLLGFRHNCPDPQDRPLEPRPRSRKKVLVAFPGAGAARCPAGGEARLHRTLSADLAESRSRRGSLGPRDRVRRMSDSGAPGGSASVAVDTQRR